MPHLKIRAQNLTKAPTRFLIHAYDKRIPALESKLYVAHTPNLDPAFVTELVSPMLIEPGVIWETESPQDFDFDMTTLFWYVPRDRQGRFHLLSFNWGNKPILSRGGIV